ncbi:MAG: dethiobiotin synthase [Oligoflexia bacterium]|nr:dethiobiotin synthase [Oligoflexia bacterium]
MNYQEFKNAFQEKIFNRSKKVFITGTDTEVGKTIVSLGLCLHWKADYWKPIQTGRPTDSDFIKKFLPSKTVYPSSYQFKAPLSPNQASFKENKKIDLKKIQTPKSSCLVVEGIGGVYVPLNDKQTVLDLIQFINYPVIVVARSGLGTLNHTLLTLTILKQRKIKILGVILSGPFHPDNKRDIEKWSGVPVILELRLLKSITKKALLNEFKKLKI